MPSRIRLSLLCILVTTLVPTTGRAQAPAAEGTSRQREEAARENRQKVPEIFAAMTVRPGAVVADVGAGDGFLTVRLARAVGLEGRVIAVDINTKVLERLRTRVQQERFDERRGCEGR
jgi:predicted methyltransferase